MLALLMPEQFEPWLQGKADAAALHPVTNGLPATLATVCVRASTSVLSLRSSFVASVHEVLDLFERERAVLIGVHGFKDPLVRRLKFLQ